MQKNLDTFFSSPNLTSLLIPFFLFKLLKFFFLSQAPLLELAEDKDVRQLLEVGRQLFTNSNITVRNFFYIFVFWYVCIFELLGSVP